MKHEKLSEALDGISDTYITEAAQSKKKKPFPWLGAIAAVLAVAVLVGISYRFLPGQAEDLPYPEQPHLSTQPPVEHVTLNKQHLDYLVAAPAYPKMAAYPVQYEEGNYDAWKQDQRAIHNQPDGYADNLQTYFSHIIPEMLTGSDGQNVVCSPVNIYMALAMLAETTDGESRQQILDLLKADSMEALRTQAGQVWKAHYNDDGLSTSVLGSSLWLHEDIAYNESTVNALAEHYYASVFRGQLGTDAMNTALQSWLNEQTGGLLQEQAQNVKLAPNSNLALATTVLYQVQWLDEFREQGNTQGTFHGTDTDTEETFMNRQLPYGPYYWSENFGAVYLQLEDGSRMWLLLPDEGVAPEDILPEAGAFFAQNPYAYDSEYKNQKHMIINLSLPKFDVASDMDLVEKLQKLGVADVFQAGKADFSPILPQEDGGYIDQVKHAARVSIDEKGVTAAAFTVIDRCGAGMPPEEQIDFVLNRPFLFYIESRDGLPLFTGIVNRP